MGSSLIDEPILFCRVTLDFLCSSPTSPSSIQAKAEVEHVREALAACAEACVQEADLEKERQRIGALEEERKTRAKQMQVLRRDLTQLSQMVVPGGMVVPSNGGGGVGGGLGPPPGSVGASRGNQWTVPLELLRQQIEQVRVDVENTSCSRHSAALSPLNL